MTLEGWESTARRVGALVALATAVLLAPGIAASARSGGRTVGRQVLSPARLALISAGWFGAAALLWRPLPVRLRRGQRLALLLTAVPIYLTGMMTVVAGRVALGTSHRVSTTVGLQLAPEHRLVEAGPFAILRHPMYAGLTLAALGALLLYRTWATVFFVAQLPALVARARLEDRALAAEFGFAWVAYRDRVPAWIPHLRPGRG